MPKKPHRTVFHWAWNAEPLQVDPSMTRKRAAILLRDWRSNPNTRLERVGRGRYRIEMEGAGCAVATMTIARGPDHA